MLKILSILLSFSLIFSSIAPSYAQVREKDFLHERQVAVRDNLRVVPIEERIRMAEMDARRAQYAKESAQTMQVINEFLQQVEEMRSEATNKTKEQIEEERKREAFAAFKEQYLLDLNNLRKQVLEQELNQLSKKERALIEQKYNELLSDSAIQESWSMYEFSYMQAMQKAEEKALSDFKAQANSLALSVQSLQSGKASAVAKLYPVLVSLGILSNSLRADGRETLRRDLEITCSDDAEGKVCWESRLVSVVALGTIGETSSQEDKDAIKNFFVKGMESSYKMAVLMTCTPAFLILGYTDPLKQIVDKQINKTYNDLFVMFDLENYVKAGREMVQGIERDRVYNNNWFKMGDDGSDTIYKNDDGTYGEMWFDFAEYVGHIASLKDGNSEGVTTDEIYAAQDLCNYILTSNLGIYSGRGAGYLNSNELQAGMYAGGYFPKIIGFKGQSADGNGNITYVDTETSWNEFNKKLTKNGWTSTTEWIIWSLYDIPKIDIDPHLGLSINNKLVDAMIAYRGSSRTAQLGMVKKNSPSSSDVASWKNYNNWLSAARGIDLVITVIATLYCGYGLLKGVVSGARGLYSLAKMMRVSRAGLAMAGRSGVGIFQVTRTAMKVMLRRSYGTSSLRLAIINANNRTLPFSYFSEAELAGSVRNYRTLQIQNFWNEAKTLLSEAKNATSLEAAQARTSSIRAVLERATSTLKKGVGNKKIARTYIENIKGILAEAEAVESQVALAESNAAAEAILAANSGLSATVDVTTAGSAVAETAASGGFQYQGTVKQVTNPHRVFNPSQPAASAVPSYPILPQTPAVQRPSLWNHLKIGVTDWAGEFAFNSRQIMSGMWNSLLRGSRTAFLATYLTFAPIVDSGMAMTRFGTGFGNAIRTEQVVTGASESMKVLGLTSDFTRAAEVGNSAQIMATVANPVRTVTGAASAGNMGWFPNYFMLMAGAATPEALFRAPRFFSGKSGFQLMLDDVYKSFSKDYSNYLKQISIVNGQEVGFELGLQYQDYLTYSQRQQDYWRNQFTTRNSWLRNSYPLSASFYSFFNNVKDGIYFNYVAPFTLRNNLWYQNAQKQNVEEQSNAKTQEETKPNISDEDISYVLKQFLPMEKVASYIAAFVSDHYFPWKQVAAATAGVGSAAYLLGQFVTPEAIPYSVATLGFIPWFRGNSATVSAANNKASDILSQKNPLPTELVAILQSEAAQEYKEQALYLLYSNHHLFDKFVQNLPSDVWAKLSYSIENNHIDSIKSDLYSFWKLGYFDAILEQVNNGLPLETIAKNLAELTVGKDFKELSQLLYDETPVLPENTNSFTGVVPELKDVDKEVVLAAARNAGWAVENANSGTVTSDGEYVYYENDIPVYYRDSKGNLSANPVILLRQDSTNFLGNLLSKMSWLSTPKGVKIPQGFVLAMDENGNFKFVAKPGSRAKQTKKGKKLQQDIYANGSHGVALDLPYTTTDLLAFAKLLESGMDINFQLKLSKPNSFKAFVNMLGALFGMNVDNVMVSPFKEVANQVDSELVKSVAPNAFGGVGYVTPKVAGELTPLMQQLGMDRSTFAVLGVTLATLVASMVMGIHGFIDPKEFSLGALAFPMVILVLAASLLRSAAPLLLNHYKNPTMRTAANLQMSTFQQGSKVALSVFTFLVGFGKVNSFVTVPFATLLVLGTMFLFSNTPMGERVLSDTKNAIMHPGKSFKQILTGSKKFFPALFKGITAGVLGPIADLFSWGKNKISSRNNSTESESKTDEQRYQESYNNEFLTKQDTKDAISRVRLAYASYAASIMLLNQLVGDFNGSLNTLFGSTDVKWGQMLVAVFGAFSLLVRSQATKWVKSGKYSDDQLTGISFVGLTAMPLLLAIVPYTGLGWLGVIALLGVLLNMSTAVPGQLDNTRLQNNVTAIMQAQKNMILQDETLSKEEKESRIKDLTAQEKYWSAQAGKSYSNANAKGIYGIYAAVIASIVMPLLGIDSKWITRAVFGYAGLAAFGGAYKTFPMAASFMKSLFGKKDALVVTDDQINNNEVNAETFGIDSEKKASTVLVELTKGKDGIKALKDKLAPHTAKTMASEVKLTNTLRRMVEIYNRLVASAEKLGLENVKPTFADLLDLAKSYQMVLDNSSVSTLLQRNFNELLKALCVDGDVNKGIVEQPNYMPEGNIKLPVNYSNLLKAQDLIKELETFAADIEEKNNVTEETYSLFVKYHAEARNLLQQYMTDNPSEAAIAMNEERRIDALCQSLKTQIEYIRSNSGATKSAFRDFEDLLIAY